MSNLNKIIKNAEKLNGTRRYKLSEILSDKFIIKNTQFSSFNDMLDQSGLQLNRESYEKLSDNKELNEFISLNTKFDSFLSMVETASSVFIKNKLLKK